MQAIIRNFALFAVFTTVAVPAPLVAGLESSRPNILLIVGDDMGYADVGFHGCHDIPTPHLDSLASAGIRCTNGYVSGPYCSPTRAGLLTGRYQQRFGHEFNPSGNQGLPLTESTLADRLRSSGYKTGLVGKWHLGSQPEQHPLRRGFDEFFGFTGGAHDYFQDQGILRGQDPVQEQEYLTDAFGREAVDFIGRHSTEPWFLYLAFNAVHTPMQADDPRLQKFSQIPDNTRRTYAAMMSAMDDAIGRVRQKLVEEELADNTLILFISDNGGPTMPGVTVNGSVNSPLRGSKRTTLEGGIRVPFLVAWPGILQPSTLEHPVIQLDLHATILAVTGTQPPADQPLDGVNLLPWFQEHRPNPPHEMLFWRFGEQMAIRKGDFKLVRYDSNADTLTGQGRQPVTTAKLYNLKDDLSESKDLSATHPEKLAELQMLWETWNAELMDPLWGTGGDGQKKNEGTTGKAGRKKKKKN